MEECATCTKPLKSTNDGTAIGCDKCPSWFHSSCTSLTKDQLKVLKAPSCDLMWFCSECKSDTANSSTTTLVSQQSVGNDQINLKLDAILSALAISDARLATIEENVNVRDAKIEALEEKFNSVELQIDELRQQVDFEVTAIRNQFCDLTASAGSNTNNTCDSCLLVGHRVESMERQSLLANLILDGLPSLSVDNRQEDLPAAIIKLANIVKVTLQKDDIISCYRIPVRRSSAVTRCAPVIIKFRHQAVRDHLYFSYLQKRNLMLSDLLPQHPISSRLYLSEHITAQCKSLLRRCAALKKKKQIVRYFTRNGKLYLTRRHEDDPTLATPQLVGELEEKESSK